MIIKRVLSTRLYQRTYCPVKRVLIRVVLSVWSSVLLSVYINKVAFKAGVVNIEGMFFGRDPTALISHSRLGWLACVAGSFVFAVLLLRSREKAEGRKPP